MKVALGTLELDDETRKKLGKVVVGSSYLKRDQARDWALGLINDELDKIRAGSPAIRPPDSNKATATESAAGVIAEPPTAPKDADHLPEPAPPSTATGGTTATTGGLGAAGTPGGTV